MNIARHLLRWFNLGDALITAYVVSHGFAWEVNPLMRALLDISPWLFIAFKVAIGELIVRYAWRPQDKWMLYASTAIYAVVFGWGALNLCLVVMR